MLQEAIYKFKASGPMLLPDLIDNYWIGETKAYEDYAILPYEVHIPQPIDKVLDMFEMNADLAIWKSHSTLPLLATQNYPFWLKYD
ncbi:hypothetical protein [Phocaeicola vulgatus]|uniref:hypothetical protein n=1 Tax=Phocaeicola vulgatus TaxID=821 RepID=UPI0035668B4B